MKRSGALVVCAIAISVLSSGEQRVEAQTKKTDPELRLGEIMAGSKHEHTGSKAGQKYAGKDQHIRAGMKLYHKLNCVGCHFDGGGGMGPALIDSEWIYGSSIDHIAASIRDGRPKGMPSFHAIASEEEIWQIAAYVHSGMKEHKHAEGSSDREPTKDAKDSRGEGTKKKREKDDKKDHQH